MSAAHVCDECKTVAPINEATGWRHVEIINSISGDVLYAWEKPQYDFCSWRCLAVFSDRVTTQRFLNLRARAT